MRTRRRSLVSVLIGGVSTISVGGVAEAQEVNNDYVLAEVVVTAQKRDERLLDVPVAVTAVEGSALARENLVRLPDYATRIPGLAVAGPNIRQISLRGISTGGATSPTVAVTIDDVPVGSSARIASQFPDVDPAELARIEVLRGPQGTLYGAASLGGLMKLVTKDADPSQWSGRIEVGANEVEDGSDGTLVRGSGNIPILEDKLALRVSGFRRDDPKYIDNINPLVNAKDVNESITKGGRAALFFSPIDDLTINVSYLDQELDGVNNNGPTQVTGYPTDFRPVRGYFVTNVAPSETTNSIELTQARIRYDIGALSIASVSGWGEYANNQRSDVTTTFPFVFNPVAGGPIIPGAPAGSSVRIDDGNSVDKFTQELRFGYTADTWQVLLGGFYTKEDSIVLQALNAYDPSGGPLSSLGVFPVDSTFEETAAFADFTYNFTDRLDLQVGGRYSKNEQDFVQTQVVIPAAAPFFGPTGTAPARSSDDDAFTWLVTPRYKFNEDMMLFFRVATGYRPGGPNLAVAGAPETFDPDTVTNYELGFKTALLDRTLIVDASIFDIEWEDIQLQNNSPANLVFLTNGGEARSRGIELATVWSPGAGWVITANATYTDAELTEELPVPATGSALIGGKGTRLPFVPEFSSNLGVEKAFEVFGNFNLTFGVNWSHIGERNSLLRSSTAPIARRGSVELPAYDVVDARINLSDGKWDLSLYARNIGTERGVVALDDRQGAVPTTNASFIVPQTIGMLASFSF